MKKKERFLLACDLDRTVLPNGKEPLSEGAVEAFNAFVGNEEVILAYLSGRNIELINAALTEYAIPIPDIAVGDVGTSMYFRHDGFRLHEGWNVEIASDWNGLTVTQLKEIIGEREGLELQEPENQNTFKLSYYTPIDFAIGALKIALTEQFSHRGVKAAMVFSIDEARNVGLLDILPESATKKHALQYLERYFELPHSEIVFAGDSGNDIEPLTSGYRAIVVNNATEAVKEEVRTIGAHKKITECIYFAKGEYDGMNGNYTAGILEGLKHFGFLH